MRNPVFSKCYQGRHRFSSHQPRLIKVIVYMLPRLVNIFEISSLCLARVAQLVSFSCTPDEEIPVNPRFWPGSEISI